MREAQTYIKKHYKTIKYEKNWMGCRLPTGGGGLYLPSGGV